MCDSCEAELREQLPQLDGLQLILIRSYGNLDVGRLWRSVLRREHVGAADYVVAVLDQLVPLHSEDVLAFRRTVVTVIGAQRERAVGRHHGPRTRRGSSCSVPAVEHDECAGWRFSLKANLAAHWEYRHSLAVCIATCGGRQCDGRSK